MHQWQEAPIGVRSKLRDAMHHAHQRGCFVEQNPTAMATKASSFSRSFLLLLPILFSSCSHFFYMPNAVNVPLFREKGEVSAVVAMTSDAGDEDSGFPLDPLQQYHLFGSTPQPDAGPKSTIELQAAYALTDHWAVMANGAFYRNGDDRGHLWEIGAGYHARISEHFVAETYAGAGMGRLDLKLYSQPVMAFPLIRGFLQPDIGYVSRNFEAALSARVCPLWYTGLGEGPSSLVPTSCRVLVEPAITLRVGLRSAKFQLQYCYSKNTGEQFAMMDQIVSFGLQLNLNNAFKKRTSSHP